MTRRLVILAAVLLAVFLFFYFDLSQYFSELGRFKSWVDESPLMAAAVFVSVYILVAGLNLPGVGPLSIAAGAMFGLFWGVVMVSFASTIGATIGMLLSRTLLREWVYKKFSGFLIKVNQGIEKDGVLYLMTLRLIPPIPFFVINAVFGLTKMPVRHFYLASQIGMLPATILFVNVGASVGAVERISMAELFTPQVILSFAALIAFPYIIKALLRSTGYARKAEDIGEDV